MVKYAFIVVLIFLGMMSCGKKEKMYPKLEMTPDEIVHAMVQMYAANAAIHINDVKYRDSTSNKYFAQVAQLTGKSIEVIRSDFDKLQSMPDSLLVLQNRALDTLRTIQENQLFKPSKISIGLN